MKACAERGGSLSEYDKNVFMCTQAAFQRAMSLSFAELTSKNAAGRGRQI
jgi:hypothetical protein